MRIVFCVYEWSTAMLPLQPWLTLKEVGERLAQRGHAVHVLTDCVEPARLEGIEVHCVGSLRGTNASRVRQELARLHPEALVMLPTPLNIVSTPWLDDLSGCRRVGFASYPFYTPRELLRAAQCLPWRDVQQYLRNLLIPEALWRSAMQRRLESVIAQSETTTERLSAAMGEVLQCHWVPPGIELQAWPLGTEAVSKSDVTKLLYLGAATAIRGFDVAMGAMVRVTDMPVHLRVLARGADSTSLARIHAAVAKHKLEGRVEIEGGWIDRVRLAAEIQAADAVLLPFVLVPSELPVTVMEAIACGTPVIGSDVDGLPSTIGPAGAVARQGSPAALAVVISRLASDVSVARDWRDGCLHQRGRMKSWDTVTDHWEGILANG